ncbi:phage portal protein (plasmid) [Microbulbifer sp. CnH-101-G]|uniref:phage portal protein n=1 Tax=Microbulbifer sp. CnH-101-G TaxID=3243393 RepID=UPI00403A6F7A
MGILDIFRREKPAAQRRIAPKFRVPRAKPMVPRQRSFESAKSSNITASWGTKPKSADQVIYQNLTALRARSRDQRCNSDHVRRFDQLVRINVVGARGIVVQSKVMRPGGKEPDKPARQAIESEFQRWGRAENCHLQGRLSWVEIQQQIMSCIAIDGEAIVREHAAGPYGYQLEIIDSELLDVRFCEELKNGNRILFGIEFDQRGRAVAYHFSQPSPSPHTYTHTSGAHYERVDASEIWHLFITEFVGQKRGIPWTATGLFRLKMLSGFEDAALVNARVGASKMGFITESDSSDVYIGDDQDPLAGEHIDPETGDHVEELEPAYIERLAPGQGFVGFDPTYPSGDFDPFMQSCLHSISMGFGVSHHGLSGNLSKVNYSSAKVGDLVDKENWMYLQNWLIDKLGRPVFETWMERQHLLHTIKIGTKPLGRPLPEYLLARYQPKRWKEVDELKAVSAQREAVALGKASISRLILEDGEDPDEVFEQLAEDVKRLRDLGLPLPTFLPPEAYKALTESEPDGAPKDAD